MKKIPILFSLLLFFAAKCQEPKLSIKDLLSDSPSISGKPEYLESPFVTAGNRVYIVGHQNGSFPELGWHIPGEMGGIWDHPIKLADGFEAEIISHDRSIELSNADSFTNYPVASKHDFKLKDIGIEVERWQFVPDDSEGIAIQYIIKNKSEKTRKLDFIFKVFSDLRPTWLGEKTNMIDGKDKSLFYENEGYWFVKDSLNPWSLVYKADRKADFRNVHDSNYKGLGTGTSLGYYLSIPARGSEIITFYMAGSYSSVSGSLKNFRNLQSNIENEIVNKRNRYKELAEKSKLSIPDKRLQETFEWLKYNSAWLVQEVPEIGTGITAGIPDYPWWFGVDSEYALKGYMAVGQKNPVYSTIQLLDSVSKAVNGNGKIIHEMSTNGVVFNDGNINETPQFTSLIWEIYTWNGDQEFLKRYFPTIKKGLEWLITEKDLDHNLFPDGFGMMEIHGLDSEMIDVASYTQKAFEDASKIAMSLNNVSLADKYAEIAKELTKKINDEFWSEEFGSYADFIGTDEQALRLIDDAIVRADTLNKPWSVKELEEKKQYILNNPSDTSRPFVLHHNWVVNTPMEMNIAEPEKAKIALQTAEKFTNPFGVFVTGIDRDEEVSNEEASFKGSKAFSYTGAVMTLPTGVQAISENNYGNPDKALDYLKRMTRSFSFAFPGSMYEVSPDYGMITQAWNIYSFAIPIIQQFFGIQPMASQKTVIIDPLMPTEWNNASLENVEISDNKISIYFSESGPEIKMEIVKTNPDWKIILPLSNYKLLSSNLSKNEVNRARLETNKSNVVLKLKRL